MPSRSVPLYVDSHSTLWAKTARELGGCYTAGGLFQQEELCVPLPPWQVRLTLDPVALLTTTVLAVSCTVQQGFFLQLEHGPEGSQVSCSHPQKLEELFAFADYRQSLSSVFFVMEVGGRGLRCTTQGAVAESTRLIRLIEIVAETLQKLGEMRIIVD